MRSRVSPLQGSVYTGAQVKTYFGMQPSHKCAEGNVIGVQGGVRRAAGHLKPKKGLLTLFMICVSLLYHHLRWAHPPICLPAPAACM